MNWTRPEIVCDHSSPACADCLARIDAAIARVPFTRTPLSSERVAAVLAGQQQTGGTCHHPPDQPDLSCQVCRDWLTDDDWADQLGLTEPKVRP